MLFDAFMDSIRENPESSDLRLNVFELNARALAWYLQLGFGIVKLGLTRLVSMKHGRAPLVLLGMQRKDGKPGVPYQRLLGKEMCGQQVKLVPPVAPTAFLSSVYLNGPLVKVSHSLHIIQFDPSTGLHLLKDKSNDDRKVDLTTEMAHGRLLPLRPLHEILPEATLVARMM